MLCHQTLADDLMDPGLIISQLKSMYHDFSWKIMVKKKSTEMNTILCPTQESPLSKHNLSYSWD